MSTYRTNTPKPILLWATGSMFLLYQYIIRVAPSVMIGDIQTIFGIDPAAFGHFSGVYYIGYSLAHIPIGIMLDRFPLKRQMLAYVALVILGISPMVLSESWFMVVIGRFVTGIGSSAAILGLFKIVSSAFPENKFSQMIGYSVTIGLMGPLYAGAPLNYIKNVMGFEFAIHLLIVLGSALFMLICLLFKSVENDNKIDVYLNTMVADAKTVLLNKNVINISIMLGLMVGVIEGFADIWGPMFMRKVKNFGEYEGPALISIIYISICAFTPILGILTEKVGKYFLMLFYCAMIMGFGMLYVIFFMPTNHIFAVIAMVMLGFAASYQVIGIYKASTYAPQKSRTLAASVANMMIMIFGYFFHSIIGQAITRLQFIGFTENESIQYGLSIIPVMSIIAGFVMLFFNKRDKTLQ